MITFISQKALKQAIPLYSLALSVFKQDHDFFQKLLLFWMYGHQKYCKIA